MIRFGEFSPFDRLFTLGSVFENYKSGANIWASVLTTADMY
jgi:hypothetical protein